MDINNDGIQEVVHIGETSQQANAQLKVYVYEQSAGSLVLSTEISDQFDNIRFGAYDFGNVDKDNDIDFAITGRGNNGLQTELYINETVYTETIDPIFTGTTVDIPVSDEGTFDFIDFDNDGNIDIAMTGFGQQGPMFKILVNNGLEDADLAFTELPSNGLDPLLDAKLEFGDFNGDGYADVLYSGLVSGQGKVSKLSLIHI